MGPWVLPGQAPALPCMLGACAAAAGCFSGLTLAGLHPSGLMPADMDGFKLLEQIGLELDLPVISECNQWSPSWQSAALTLPLVLLSPLLCTAARASRRHPPAPPRLLLRPNSDVV